MAVLWATFHYRRDGSRLRPRRSVLPHVVVPAEPSRPHHLDAVSCLGILRAGWCAVVGSGPRAHGRRAGHSRMALAVSAWRFAVYRPGPAGTQATEGSD